MSPLVRRLLALANALLLCFVTAGCGTPGGSRSASPSASGVPTSSGSAPSSAIPALANVSLADGLVVRATVGPEGGNLQTTGPDGTVYLLKIPPRALLEPTEIAMVPITAAKDVPAGVTLAGGVHLLPEGLQFASPAALDMTLATSTDLVLAPFAYAGDLVDRHLYPAQRAGTVMTLPIIHFSGYAALQASEVAAMLPWFPPPTLAGELSLQNLMAAVALGDLEARREEIGGILRTWLDAVIRPDAEEAISSEYALDWIDQNSAVERATTNLRVFRVALGHVTVLGLTFPDIQAAFESLTGQLYEHLFDATNRGCSEHPDLALTVLVPAMVFWRSTAEWMLTPAVPESLSTSRFERDLCVRAAFDPAGGADFPAELLAGQTGTLRVRAGYTLPGLAPRFDAAMVFLVQGTNVEPATQAIVAEPGLSGSSDFTWTQATEHMVLSVEACLATLWNLGLLVCDQRLIERGVVAPPPSCPRWYVKAGTAEVTSLPETGWRSLSTSISPQEGFASAAIGGNLVVSLGVAGHGATVRGDASFIVDSASAGPGTHAIALNWIGEAFWSGSDQTGPATVTITMSVNGEALPVPQIRVPSGARGIVIPATLEVVHNEVIEISFSATASHGDTTHDLNVVGSLEFTTPAGVSILQSECETQE